VALTSTVDGKAGAQFWVVSIGGGASRQTGSTHRVSLQLNPVSSSSADGKARVKDEQPANLK
jgi:hypothetical protein